MNKKETVISLLEDSADFDLVFEKPKQLNIEKFTFIYHYEDRERLSRSFTKDFYWKCVDVIESRIKENIKIVKYRFLEHGKLEMDGQEINLQRRETEALEITVQYYTQG